MMMQMHRYASEARKLFQEDYWPWNAGPPQAPQINVNAALFNLGQVNRGETATPRLPDAYLKNIRSPRSKSAVQFLKNRCIMHRQSFATHCIYKLLYGI
ncbi:MAG: hypothetical protein ACLPYB_11085 [Desulfobaccales bacterium]